MSCGKKTLVGRVYRSKKWAQRFAEGRVIRKVKKGWKILKKKKERKQ